ncbi:palmitoyltransferase for Vac8p [Dispira parvispora]|uniref:Palmitoyltransferase n=1 Tax=Dispira parvispora TaxID=1520584 RepID=A0A9W8E364_9FUNG|nr:palmitoyltransferase for Vac8p [Dispira parvispora]
MEPLNQMASQSILPTTGSSRGRFMRILGVFPVLFGFAIIFWSYYTYVGKVCRTVWSQRVGQALAYLIVYHVLFGMFVWCYLQCILTSPGTSPRNTYQGDEDTVIEEEENRNELSEEPEEDPAQHHSVRANNPLGTVLPQPIANLISQGEFGVENNAHPEEAVCVTLSGDTSQELVVDEVGTYSPEDDTSPKLTHGLPLTADQPVNTTGEISRPSTHASRSPLLPPVVGQLERSTGGRQRSYTNQSTLNGQVGHHLNVPFQHVTFKVNGKIRFCRKCQAYKPDRAHHCSACQVCVLKMDHHCPWINNCVGWGNQKAFLLFLFWGSLYCGYCLATTLPVFIDQLLDGELEKASGLHLLFLVLVSGLFTISLTVFIGFQLYLLFRNVTTIETYEKHSYNHYNTQSTHGYNHQNIFDLGWRRNFTEVMGPWWHLWLVPVGNSKGDGVTFPTSTYSYSSFPMEDPGEP